MKTFCSVVNLALIGFLGSMAAGARSQTEDPPTEATADEATVQTVLDQSPFVSARASGLGGALSTLADGSDAAYYNPAGIGGIHQGKSGQPVLRGLHFPILGAAANENTRKLNSEFSSQGGATDRSVGEAIVDANAGKRQYARASYLIDVTLGRTLTSVFSDVQFAAIKSEGESEDEGGISMKYRSLSGAGAGFSGTDSQGRIYFGIFSSANSMTLMDAENASYLDVINVDRRKSLLKDEASKWQGIATNVGLLWNIAKPWRPTLSVVARDVGNTIYKRSGSDSSGDSSQMEVEQDLTSGFSVSPELGKFGDISFIIEGHHLTAEDTSLKKKFRAGLELTFGQFGGNSIFGIRGGYCDAGASYGVNVSLGLVQLEAASQAIDIGVKNAIVTERRSVAIFSVNLAND